MKAAIIGTLALGILVLLSATILTISGRNVRQTELNVSLANAIEQTMEVMYLDHTYQISNEKEFIADFLGNLLQQLNSDSEINIRILNMDVGQGLFDVQATEKYHHFTGREGSVTTRKTVILEEYEDPNEKYYQVLFQNPDGSTYKAYTIYRGSNVINPPNPHGFVRWKKLNPDGSEDAGWDGQVNQMRVTSDLVFQAVCR